jgi:hypothetical protein
MHTRSYPQTPGGFRFGKTLALEAPVAPNAFEAALPYDHKPQLL